MEITINRNACGRKSILLLAAVVVLAGFRPGLAEEPVIKKLRQAAEQGDSSAQYTLGGMYFVGRGVPKDDRAGVKWIRQAAEQRHFRAQAALGFQLKQGPETQDRGRPLVKTPLPCNTVSFQGHRSIKDN